MGEFITRTMLAEQLSDFGFEHFVDSDGDVGGLGPGFRFYLFPVDDSEWVRYFAMLDQEFESGARPWLLDRLNEWNGTRMGPHAYTEPAPDGRLAVCLGDLYVAYRDDPKTVQAEIVRWVLMSDKFVEWLESQGEPVV